MSVNGSALSALTKELLNQWRQTKDYWQDAKSEEFERKYIEELLTAMDSSVTVIDKLDQLLSKVRHDCE